VAHEVLGIQKENKGKKIGAMGDQSHLTLYVKQR
jgi:hypothetical protein